MGPEIVNRVKDSEIHGNVVGRDNINVNIILFQDSERKFVVTCNANIKPVYYFIGRETELQDLRQRIEAGRKSVLVSGMGGIGKTQICRKLFEEYSRNGKNGPFSHIGYIEYGGDMNNSLQTCLKFKKQERQEDNLVAAWRELEYLAADGKLLLFVDNVDRPMYADPGLQRLKEIPGAVVLTSRQSSICDEFEPYPIGFLDKEQCKEIYEKIRFRGSGRKVRPEEEQDLEYIIVKLAGRHTITIELLANLAKTKPWPVKRLRNELEKKGFQLTFHKAGELVNIQESYEKLYNLSELTGAEQNILEAFSVFPYIPLAAEMCNKWLLADAGVSEDYDILMGLYQKGWLQFDIEQESYVMHPVFTQYIYERCKPKMENHWGLIHECQRSIYMLKEASLLECQKYVPFAQSLIEKIVIGLERNRFSSLLHSVEMYEREIKFCEICLKIFKNIENGKGMFSREGFNNLGNTFISLGEYRKPQEKYEKSIRINESISGENYMTTANSYNNLATLYAVGEEYEEAEKWFEKCLGICERVLGEEHLDTAISYNNLAYIYAKQEKYGKAKKLYKKALTIRERVLGEEDPDTAVSYNNLAEMYLGQGYPKRALLYYHKAYKVFMFRFGENHPNTYVVHKNMEIAYSKWNPDGDFEQWLEQQMKK